MNLRAPNPRGSGPSGDNPKARPDRGPFLSSDLSSEPSQMASHPAILDHTTEGRKPSLACTNVHEFGRARVRVGPLITRRSSLVWASWPIRRGLLGRSPGRARHLSRPPWRDIGATLVAIASQSVRPMASG